MSERLVYSVQEAAELIGLSSDKVYELIRARVLPHVRLGRRILIPRKSLETWLENAVELDWQSTDAQ